MDNQSKFDVTRPEMSRPAMVNGFWPESERSKAEAAAEELRGIGLGQKQVSFSQTTQGHIIEYNSGGLITWIKGKLFSGNAAEPEVPDVPVVLRTWPDEGNTERVCEIMNRHGAYKVNHWEAQSGTQSQQTAEGSQATPGA